MNATAAPAMQAAPHAEIWCIAYPETSVGGAMTSFRTDIVGAFAAIAAAFLFVATILILF